MLMLKNLNENFELAEYALQNWEYDKESLTERFSHFRISSNAIYPFDRNGELCFLRLAPTEEKSENNIKGEIEFLGYLKENNFPSMRPIEAKNGEVILKLQTPWSEYYASVFACVSGIPVEETDYSPQIMECYGETLGLLHKLSSEYAPKVKKWTHNDALKWVENIFAEYDAPSYMADECRKVCTKLADLPVDKTTYGLVHYDFEPDNVFYDEQNNVCNVIDFDDGMYHFYVLDIEQVFDCLAEELEGERLEEAKEQFIKGYRSKFPLPDDYEITLPLMRRFCNIFAYARLVRCVAEKTEYQPEWLIDLAERLTQKIHSIEQSVKTTLSRKIRKMTSDEITIELFKNFSRHQKVTKCWRKINGEWVTVEVSFEENWDKQRFAELVEELKETINTGGAVFGGFENEMLKGFVACEGKPMGSRGQYLELSIIQVSEDLRGSGMGKALFSEVKAWAAARGAEKLYISAHSSVESQAFYKAVGCVEAEEYSAPHVENGPFDCQMEYVLTK